MNPTLGEISSKDVWEAFIDAARPHTFLHSWHWGEFQAAMGNKVWRLGIYEGETLISAALVFKVVARRGSFLFCPHGPILDSRFEIRDSRLINTLTDYLKQLGVQERCDFIRISPLFPDTPENNSLFLDLGFRDAPVHMMHPELSWILDVTRSEEALLTAMRKNSRYSIRRAEKDGVVITKSSDIKDLESFRVLYDETVQRQHFTPFPRDYFRKEFEVFSCDGQAQLFFAHYRGDLISTAFIIFSRDAGFYHHGASTPKYPKLTASHLLQWEVIRETKRRECTFYNFWGVSPEDEPNHPWAGLSLFKRGFGGFAESYVHAKDFPLTSKYWLNWIIEKARKIKRGY
ncbi:peptidoglycan bridge formation glycyltransferase FemA/FemB family protein [Candidatus Peregrinibacteria bacterium]|nr:peptidoglycan bridge formation glycyltransferase FemA/FemB family protein [Candidatus Peregrinibacteria bacterium]